MHCCLNVVTEKEGYPAAILIRSIVPPFNKPIRSEEIVEREIKGPGRVCKKLKIDWTLNEKPAVKRSELWIEDRGG